MSIGRPTEYTADLCDKVIELMSSGLSLTASAAELDFSRETFYAWEKTHPDFSYAIKIARAKRALKLERDLLGAAEGPVVTARIFALKNACPEEWREKVYSEIGGKDGGAIEIADVSADRRKAALALLLARKDKDVSGS